MKLMTIDDAIGMNRGELNEMYSTYVNPAITKLFGLVNFDRHFVKAEGMSIWDEDGNEYYDFLGGFGSVNFGHNPAEIYEAIERVKQIPSLIKADLSPFMAVLAHNLSQITPGELTNTFFCNSGTEAVEGALKTARIATGKPGLVYCEGSFHGKSMGSLSVTGREKYQKPFMPLVPECYRVPYGDSDALEETLRTGNIAAFIVEPVQGEGGVIVPPDGYLRRVREICSKYGVLLIVDEVQTGFGRTGSIFASEAEGVAPDIMCVAKSLGAGVVPIGAFITTPDVWKKAYGSIDRAYMHTSTFGGNTLACAVGIAAIELMLRDNVAENAAKLGKYMLDNLQNMANKYGMLKEARGKGLLVGIEFSGPSDALDKLTRGLMGKLSNEYVGSMVAAELMNDHGIITAYTLNNPNVIRLEPPLTVTKDHIDKLLAALDAIFSKNKGLLGLALNSSKTVVKSLFGRNRTKEQ